jgi:hypothetical protein
MKRDAVRVQIREILRDFYDTDTVATGGITSSATELPVNNYSRYDIGDVISVESEIMVVRGITVSTGSLSVGRGYNLSTAAAHVATKAIIINPEYSDRSLNQCIDFGIGDTFDRQAGIWIETIDETLTTSNAREYTIPTGLTYIARIQIQGSDGFFAENRDWQLIGTKIQFFKDLDTGMTIRCIGTSYQPLLDDDSSDYTLGDEQMQFVIYDAAFYALQQRFSHRIKATEYSAAINDRAGQPLDIINMVNTLKRQVDQLRVREFKPRMFEFATRAPR